jgi:RHS repeat-associated protein
MRGGGHQDTANGELETKTNSATSETWLFQYDVLGNLLTVGLPNGDLVEYLVDGRGRRVGKKKNGVLLKRWIYRDSLKPAAELDGTGNLAAQFVYGSKGNVPDFVIRAGQTYRVISDHLGSARRVVNVTNASDIPLAASYLSFGSVTGTGLDWMPFGFAGGHYDSDTGLVRFGKRDLAPELGRWTSKEPLRFQGARNFFVYALNNPINLVDLNGLEPNGAGGASGTGEGGGEGAGGIPWTPAPPCPPGMPFDQPFGPSRNDHQNRNSVNRCPAHPPTTCGGGVEDDFEFDAARDKWRGSQGNECHYDGDGNLLPDPAQTYNFYPDPGSLGHIWCDWAAHYWYGGDEGYVPNPTSQY